MYTITFNRKNGFNLLSPYWIQGCVEGQNICMHGVICSILINLIMQHDYFQKRKQINLLTHHILKKLILYWGGGGAFLTTGA